ncbi:YaaC family protein [Jeotgalibacillus soli]|uniref:Uncharacterized protein n=1 Tax=Jeotgalibacillus soli TaxID=889306 RepID=A0A0C2RQU6_9BACL|nr:YaaC family protein [Jeotgalibacillus soli]KIL52630.1 hypothetical protein KP78_00010 [Jeotgalibacillus soli]
MSSTFNWNRYLPFHSHSTIQSYLSNQYKQLCFELPNQLAALKSSSFFYHLEHAESCYIQSDKAPTSIQPLLQFYGISHLIKACLISKDPTYPSSTAQLAHGVSTRKKKKLHYSFLEDSVKIQKNGLFPTFSDLLFHVKHLEGNSYEMYELLAILQGDHHSLNPVQSHFLLLYNLSMIARYETMWWGDCLQYKKTDDYSIIRGFLHFSSQYIPQALLEFLLDHVHPVKQQLLDLSIQQDLMH